MNTISNIIDVNNSNPTIINAALNEYWNAKLEIGYWDTINKEHYYDMIQKKYLNYLNTLKPEALMFYRLQANSGKLIYLPKNDFGITILKYLKPKMQELDAIILKLSSVKVEQKDVKQPQQLQLIAGAKKKFKR